jgi:hypothetical protein
MVVGPAGSVQRLRLRLRLRPLVCAYHVVPLTRRTTHDPYTPIPLYPYPNPFPLPYPYPLPFTLYPYPYPYHSLPDHLPPAG